MARSVMDRASTVIRLERPETRPDGPEEDVGTAANDAGTTEKRPSATKRQPSAIAKGPSAKALRLRALATGLAGRVTDAGGAAIGSANRWIRGVGASNGASRIEAGGCRPDGRRRGVENRFRRVVTGHRAMEKELGGAVKQS